MLSLVAWCNALPPRDSQHDLQVFSKLGGNFLGRVHKVDYADAYIMVRSLQDQIALFYKHARRPPRYLVVFVDQTRLTSPGFPFVDKLDSQEAERVFATLEGARRVDVFWDESNQHAKQWLRDANLKFQHLCTKLFVSSNDAWRVKHENVLPLQLEMFSFQAIPLKQIEVAYDAHALNGVDMFPHLEELTCAAENVAFGALSRSKTLVSLDFEVPILAQQVGVMQNLKTLKVHVTTLSDVPTELGLLTNLSKLFLGGKFIGGLPSEVGKMQGLVELAMDRTQVTKLPDQLCNLSKMQVLRLTNNLNMKGVLPEGLCELRFLRHLCLEYTWLKVDDSWIKVRGCMQGWRRLPGCDRTWTRDVSLYE